MIRIGKCSPSVRANLLQLIPAHERFAAAYPNLPTDAIYYSTFYAHAQPPRLFNEEAEWLSATLQELTQTVYGAAARRILTAGFIESPRSGRRQPWHFDYRGKTENIFVPLVPLTQENGTEYVDWAEPNSGPAELARLVEIIEPGEIEDLASLPDLSPHAVRRAEAEPFEILRMPYYLLHRGTPTNGPQVRRMFFIATTPHFDFDLSEADKAPIVSWGD